MMLKERHMKQQKTEQAGNLDRFIVNTAKAPVLKEPKNLLQSL